MKRWTVLLSSMFIIANGEDCVWDRDTDFPKYPSLIMDSNVWIPILPTLEGSVREVRIAQGQRVVVGCPETTIVATGTDVVEGYCSGGQFLVVGGANYTMVDLGCESRPKETINKALGPCGEGGEQHHIGYDVTGYPFYTLIRVCFDAGGLETALSVHQVIRGRSVGAADGNPTRPAFRSDSGFYSVSPNSCYSTPAQGDLLGALLGNSSVIDFPSGYYFARGHLAPDADFITEMKADATYYYINAVPQWQKINNGNWKYMEFAVRDLAESHATDLEIWTGPWRVLKLDDTNGNPVEIYLGLTEGEEVIPAPELTWKVIYEPSSNRGVAVVVANNPYLTSFPDPICQDVCDMIKWIDFDLQDLVRGATYCCQVKDLASAVPNAPDLGSAGLLDS